MKKILAIALTLTLVFALAVSSSAALPSGWSHTVHGGAGESNFIVNADGSLTTSWGSPDVYWANLAACYDVSAFNNNYTATVEVYVPTFTKGTSTNPNQVITGISIVGDKADCSVNFTWTNSFSLHLINYEGLVDPSLRDGWGTWNVIECKDNLDLAGTVPADCASYADLNIKAGQWNTVKVIVEGDFVTYEVNGVIAIDGREAVNATGNYFVLGSRGDCGTLSNCPSFKNLVIKSNNGSVADVTAFTVAGAPAGPADIEVVAIAGAMIVALMAAAFVVRARKA